MYTILLYTRCVLECVLWFKYFYYSEPTCGSVMCADLHVTHYVGETFYITQVPSFDGFSITFRLGKCEGFYGKGLTPVFSLGLLFLHSLNLSSRGGQPFWCVCCSICSIR